MKHKAQTVVCPYCGEDFDARENGRYIRTAMDSATANSTSDN